MGTYIKLPAAIERAPNGTELKTFTSSSIIIFKNCSNTFLPHHWGRLGKLIPRGIITAKKHNKLFLNFSINFGLGLIM